MMMVMMMMMMMKMMKMKMKMKMMMMMMMMMIMMMMMMMIIGGMIMGFVFPCFAVPRATTKSDRNTSMPMQRAVVDQHPPQSSDCITVY